MLCAVFCMHAVVIRFLLGPPNMADKSNIGRIPKVHLSTSHSADEAEECFLIVYRLFSATICLLVEGQFHLLWESFKKFVAWHCQPLQTYTIFCCFSTVCCYIYALVPAVLQSTYSTEEKLLYLIFLHIRSHSVLNMANMVGDAVVSWYEGTLKRMQMLVGRSVTIVFLSRCLPWRNTGTSAYQLQETMVLQVTVSGCKHFEWPMYLLLITVTVSSCNMFFSLAAMCTELDILAGWSHSVSPNCLLAQAISPPNSCPLATAVTFF